jgi:hypothetical protein
VVAYLCRRLLGAEIRYTPIEKLCLSLYYACTKSRHYLLTNCCMVVCRYDIIKYVLQRPILRGRLGKWAYTLVEYDLAYETLGDMKGQVLADFIVKHHVKVDDEVCMVEEGTWSLFFYGSVGGQGQGIR